MAMDATRSFSFARLLNHSKVPNICFNQPFIIDFKSGTPKIAAYALVDIHKGEEIVVNCEIPDVKYEDDSTETSTDSGQFRTSIVRHIACSSLIKTGDGNILSADTALLPFSNKTDIKNLGKEMFAFDFKNLNPGTIYKKTYFANCVNIKEPEQIMKMSHKLTEEQQLWFESFSQISEDYENNKLSRVASTTQRNNASSHNTLSLKLPCTKYSEKIQEMIECILTVYKERVSHDSCASHQLHNRMDHKTWSKSCNETDHRYRILHTIQQNNQLGHVPTSLLSVNLVDIQKSTACFSSLSDERCFSQKSALQNFSSLSNIKQGKVIKCEPSDDFVANGFVSEDKKSQNFKRKYNFKQENSSNIQSLEGENVIKRRNKCTQSEMRSRNLLDNLSVKHSSSSPKLQVALIEPYVSTVSLSDVRLSLGNNGTDITANVEALKDDSTGTSTDSGQFQVSIVRHIACRSLIKAEDAQFLSADTALLPFSNKTSTKNLGKEMIAFDFKNLTPGTIYKKTYFVKCVNLKEPEQIMKVPDELTVKQQLCLFQNAENYENNKVSRATSTTQRNNASSHNTLTLELPFMNDSDKIQEIVECPFTVCKEMLCLDSCASRQLRNRKSQSKSCHETDHRERILHTIQQNNQLGHVSTNVLSVNLVDIQKSTACFSSLSDVRCFSQKSTLQNSSSLSNIKQQREVIKCQSSDDFVANGFVSEAEKSQNFKRKYNFRNETSSKIQTLEGENVVLKKEKKMHSV